MSGAYYNEIDPYAAEWLRNLIKQGLIADGEVDTRSIVDVRGDDLRGFAQCHFFAGIGGWSLALRLAGWPDDRPVWTGSCPCQPFSSAGKQKGTADERHLWPHWFRLIRECQPAVVFGEQVANAVKHGWLDLVFADMESVGYAAAAADLPACSVGAPHIRRRLWFVAHTNDQSGIERNHRRSGSKGNGPARTDEQSRSRGATGRMADAAHGDGRAGISAAEAGTRSNGIGRRGLAECGADGRMADANGWQSGDRDIQRGGQYGLLAARGGVGELGHASEQGLAQQRSERGAPRRQGEPGARQTTERADASTPWRDLEWLPCSDGKARPTQPGTFPLAHGVSNRVGRLRAYGNAIVPQVAAEFILAFDDARRIAVVTSV